MKVFTYAASDELAPPTHRAVARIMLNDGSWHPVLITGPDEAHVAERATTWWAQELAKQSPRPKKKAKAVPLGVDDPGDVI